MFDKPTFRGKKSDSPDLFILSFRAAEFGRQKIKISCPRGEKRLIFFTVSSILIYARCAGVVELADARDSKSRDGDIVWVRPPPPAPKPPFALRTGVSYAFFCFYIYAFLSSVFRFWSAFAFQIFVNRFRGDFSRAHRFDDGCRARCRVAAAIHALDGSFSVFVHRDFAAF